MSNSNPAFSRSLAFRESTLATPSADQLDEMYGRPSASSTDTGRMCVAAMNSQNINHICKAVAAVL